MKKVILLAFKIKDFAKECKSLLQNKPYEIAIPVEEYLPLCKDCITSIANGLKVISIPYDGQRYFLTAEDYAIGWLLLDSLASEYLPKAIVLFRIKGNLMQDCQVIFP